MYSSKINFLSFRLLIGLLLFGLASCTDRKEINAEFKRNINFNDGWKFKRCETARDTLTIYKNPDFNDVDWEKVTLPHTPRIEPLVVNDQWQGICWYRKTFKLDKNYQDKKIAIEFEAAMQIAAVWVNGHYKTTHFGGYLPFTVDITKDALFDQENLLVVRLDNRDNPEIPPGKPLKHLDFCMYGGLYRNVKMQILNSVHISDAVSANKVAGGGIFVKYEEVSSDQAKLTIQTHVVNRSSENKSFKIASNILNSAGKSVETAETGAQSLAALTDSHFIQTITIQNPNLWHPDHPYLYTLRTQIVSDNKVIDEMDTRLGIRTISFSRAGGFQMNGEKMFLRGTNRHQEYPYIGYALSDNAQYRDAIKIKAAGFDLVRLSHYPQAPAFMDACDELGLVVMNCIPGWQFMGNDKFKELCYQHCRDLVRRDRNHPCVITWEVSLNETSMDSAFTNTTHTIAHEEYPGDQCYTCGWTDQHYDIFIQARQHGGCKNYENGNKACIISEYGDWEYYAQNAGFDQPGFQNLKAEERNSRQLREFGEIRLLQQAMNFQEAHNDNRSTPAIGDGLWVMFDYNRGYANDLEASGVMDIFRLPKLSFYFFQSQRDAFYNINNNKIEPMIFIANYWTPDSPLDVRIFSNCDQVELFLNGNSFGKQMPDKNRFTDKLSHPPFNFHLNEFEKGELKALGYIDGKKVAEHIVMTPEAPQKIDIVIDESNRNLQADGSDAVFVYARIIDKNGNIVPDYNELVTFSVEGLASLLGHNPIKAAAGIASIIVKPNAKATQISITAKSAYANYPLAGEMTIKFSDKEN